MANRRRQPKTMGEYSWVLTNGETAVQGERAFGDTATGLATIGKTSATLIALGFFAETLLGDGTKKVRIGVSPEIEAEWLSNDTAPNDIDGANLFSEVYVKDGRTVSTLATGRSLGGRVLDYDAAGNRVLVASGLAITGPTGAGGVAGSVASRTALAAIASGSRADGQRVTLLDDGSRWKFVAASVLAADGLSVEGSNIVVVPGAGTGRWIRQDRVFVAKIPIDKTMADAAQLMLVPAGFSVKIIDDLSWDITTGFSGGAASAIGISSSNAGSSTKGDLLGGAAGDVTAVLGTAGVKQGTAGAKMDTIAHRRALRIEATEYLRYDKVTSTYTAGNGFVDVPMALELVG